MTNEIEFLTTLMDSQYVPSIISSEIKEDTSQVLLEKIDGVPLSRLPYISNFWSFKHINYFIREALQLLILLVQNDILHRDIRPANILVVQTKKGYEPRLIDFGWSTYINDIDQTITPKGLGHTYAFPGQGFSDVYAMGACLQFLLKKLHYATPIVNKLMNIDVRAYEHKTVLLEQLTTLRRCIEDGTTPTLQDRIALWIKRYRLRDRLTRVVGGKGVKKLKRFLP